jgi:hypothetical protein
LGVKFLITHLVFTTVRQYLNLITLPVIVHVPVYRGFAFQIGTEAGFFLKMVSERYANKRFDISLLAGIAKNVLIKWNALCGMDMVYHQLEKSISVNLFWSMKIPLLL